MREKAEDPRKKKERNWSSAERHRQTGMWENDHQVEMELSKLNKMCLWDIMPPRMANSLEGQEHKDKYFDTSRKILSQAMAMCNMETLISYF